MAFLKGIVNKVSELVGSGDSESKRRRSLVEAFRRDVHARWTSEDRASLVTLLAGPQARGIPDDEVELEIEMLQSGLDTIDLRDFVATNGLPVVESQHRVIGEDTCHFSSPVFLANDGFDRTGRLFLTNRRLVFAGTPRATLTWSSVRQIAHESRDLIVHPVAAGVVYHFRCNSFSDARRAAFIARVLLEQGKR